MRKTVPVNLASVRCLPDDPSEIYSTTLTVGAGDFRLKARGRICALMAGQK